MSQTRPDTARVRGHGAPLLALAALALAALASLLGSTAAGAQRTTYVDGPPALAPGLSVLRVAAGDVVSGKGPITVTFDRPVAAALAGETPDARLLTLEPAVPGRLGWRDPVTLVFVPDAPLAHGRSHAMVVAPGLAGMDGTRMTRPHRFEFRVSGARLLAATPVTTYDAGSYGGGTPYLPPETARFRVAVARRVDAAAVAAAGRVEVHQSCDTGARRVSLRGASARAMRADDPFALRSPAGWHYAAAEPPSAELTVVEVEAAEPLPENCLASLVLPRALGDTAMALRTEFRTRGPLALDTVRCILPRPCAPGTLTLRLSSPVHGAELARHLKITPHVDVTIVGDRGQASTEWGVSGAFRPRTTYTFTLDDALRDVFGQAPVRDSRELHTGVFPPVAAITSGRHYVDAHRPEVTVRHVNVDTLLVVAYPLPEGIAARAWSAPPSEPGMWLRAAQGLPYHFPLDSLPGGVIEARLPVTGAPDTETVTRLALPARLWAGGRMALVTVLPHTASAGTEVRRLQDSLRLVTLTHAERAIIDRRLRDLTSMADRPQAMRATYSTALLQRSALAVHARAGLGGGAVWVTDARSGRPVRGALVQYRDTSGTLRAASRTDANGVATLEVDVEALAAARASSADADASDDESESDAEDIDDEPRLALGYLEVAHGDERAVVSLEAATGLAWPSSGAGPWRMWNVHEVDPAFARAGAIFTDRGIYRPGERVFATAVVRTGPLHALTAPPAGDSLRWIVRRAPGIDEDEEVVVRDTVVALSRFGTAADSAHLAAGALPGEYTLSAYVGASGRWRIAQRASFLVAEYRVPQFLVDAATDTVTRYAGDSVPVTVSARYLFGAPMPRALTRWTAVSSPLRGWQLAIPDAKGFMVGTHAWRAWHAARGDGRELARGTDSLDARGTLRVVVPTHGVEEGAAMVRVEAIVEDTDRQIVAADTSFVVHPAGLYVAARPVTGGWYGAVGTEEGLDLLAVTPEGERLEGVTVTGSVVRRHPVRVPVPGGVNVWRDSIVADTVARCDVTTAAEPVRCAWTPVAGGEHEVELTARDAQGRTVRTTYTRYVIGGEPPRWWGRGAQVTLGRDRESYAVGDTARIALTSPFDDAEAWVVVGREQVMSQWRVRVRGGHAEIAVPVTARHAPHAFVQVALVARSNAARDTAAAAMPVRVGHVELLVPADARRLAVEVAPHAAEAAPGDSVRVTVRVRDAAGAPMAAEVALWAVDEGVLSLTEHPDPDPLAQLLAPRRSGTRFASSERSRQPGEPPALDYWRAARLRGTSTFGFAAAPAPALAAGHLALESVVVTGVAAAGPDGAPLRADFRSTAFYAGRVETDALGEAVIEARLPDDLTTYRLVAVAVASTRAGAGTSSLVATRAVVARPALPRFARPGDAFSAGIVVNRRDGAADTARVEATAAGALTLVDGAARAVPLAAGGRGAEARFDFRVAPASEGADAVARFGAAATAGGDAVEARLPVRPAYHPRAHTVAAMVDGEADVVFHLPEGTSAARSRLVLDVGPTAIDALRGAVRALRLHPYQGTEQLASQGRALAALAAASRGANDPVPASELEEIGRVAAVIAARQRGDGAIGYWSRESWSGPWLTLYAGLFLLDARDIGAHVDDAVLERLREYAGTVAHMPFQGDPHWPLLDSASRVRSWLAHRVAAVDYLRRHGAPDVRVEDSLLVLAPRMAWEDRLRLAEVVGARPDRRDPARALLDDAWRSASAPGRRVILADSVMRSGPWSFPSRMRPYARLMSATLALEPGHPLLGALAASVLGQEWAERWRTCNTHDLGSIVPPLVAVTARQRAAAASGVRLVAGERTVLELPPDGASRELSLTGLLAADGAVRLRLVAGGEAPAYAWVTVHEVPDSLPTTPDVTGLVVERWIERLDGTPVTGARPGEMLRVRLRVTVPEDRQFVVLEDPIPAGLEIVDSRLATSGTLGPFLPPAGEPADPRARDGATFWQGLLYGRWEDGWWSPWEHRMVRDDRMVYATRLLWRGSYDVSYVARATTAGTFVHPPAHAEELYDPALHGRTGGGRMEIGAPR